jgi:p-methyltransferase
VLLGIESGDDGVLTNMAKRATTKDYRYGIEQLKQRDIFVHASFVVGFPGESPETVRHTIDFLNETEPDTFALNHWYYLHSTPIHLRADEFELRGNGHAWSHRTMSSDEALDAADEMFESVTGSAWMPVNGLDFWGVPYLMGKGMTSAQIVALLDLAKPLTAADALRKPTSPAAEQRFKEFCEGLALEPSRYSATAAPAL